jgi:hypothetical protein
LIHWALRREELCDPRLCPDAPEEDGRCDNCPLDKLDAAQTSEVGFLIRNAVALRSALKLGIRITLDEIRADEFLACQLLLDHQEHYEREQVMVNRKG